MSSKHQDHNNYDERRQDERIRKSNDNSPWYISEHEDRQSNEKQMDGRFDNSPNSRNHSKSEMQTSQSNREVPNLDDLPIGCTLYIRNLPTHLQNEDIRNHFRVFGEVLDCRIVINPVTKESRGFGFVTYATRELADHALVSMDQTEIDGCRLHIEKARRNKPHDPTPGEYKGPTGACVRYGNRGRPKMGDYRSRRYSIDRYESRRRKFDDRPSAAGRPYDDDRRRSDYFYDHHYRYNSRDSKNHGKAPGSPYSDKYSYEKRMTEKKSPGRSGGYVRRDSRRNHRESSYSRYGEKIHSGSSRGHSYQSSRRPNQSYYKSSSHGPVREEYRHHHSMFPSGTAADTRRNSRSPKRYSTQCGHL